MLFLPKIGKIHVLKNVTLISENTHSMSKLYFK